MYSKFEIIIKEDSNPPWIRKVRVEVNIMALFITNVTFHILSKVSIL